MQNDLISRSERLRQIRQTEPDDYRSAMMISDAKKMIRTFIEEAPAVDAVSRSVFEQIKWERDCAMQQLKEHGIPFGGVAPDVVNVVRCKDCKHGIWNEDEQMYQCVEGAEFDPELAMYHGFICYEDADFFCKRGERRADDGI